MRVVFLGPPGVGKGTQSERLSEYKSIPHISTGEMLRKEIASNSDLGKRVKEILSSGCLVSDALMTSIVKKRISEQNCKDGFILDGFPRTLQQAKDLQGILDERGISLDHIVLFELDEQMLLQRLLNRAQKANREDDTEEVQKNRIKVYKENTFPLVSHYDSLGLLLRINASGTIDEVWQNLKETFS